ncbi:MAG: hypothetical protein WC718_12575 [Phycisphaerales bacterium]|jgi:hypothetical protein
MGIREFINQRPWIGWSLAGVLLVIVVYRFATGSGSQAGPYSPERMTEMVHIRFSDTGDEMEIPRGRLDKMMRERGTVLDPALGIENPKTGKFTGFPFSKGDWDEMIDRINKERGVATPKPGDKTPEELEKAAKEAAEAAAARTGRPPTSPSPPAARGGSPAPSTPAAPK